MAATTTATAMTYTATSGLLPLSRDGAEIYYTLTRAIKEKYKFHSGRHTHTRTCFIHIRDFACVRERARACVYETERAESLEMCIIFLHTIRLRFIYYAYISIPSDPPLIMCRTTAFFLHPEAR